MGVTQSDAVPIRPQGNGNGELFQNKKVKIEIFTPFRQPGGLSPVAQANHRLPDWQTTLRVSSHSAGTERGEVEVVRRHVEYCLSVGCHLSSKKSLKKL